MNSAVQLFLPLLATVHIPSCTAMQPGEFLRFGIEIEVLLSSHHNTPVVERPENIPEMVLSIYDAFADPEWPWMHLDIDRSYAGDAINEWSLTDDITTMPGEGQSMILSVPPKRSF